MLDKRPMRKYILVLLICVPSLAMAQQSPLYTQYMLNDFVINPAIAGSKPFFPLRLNAREQWEGLGSFAPSTQSLSFHAPVGDGRVGLGGLIFQDNTDPTSNMGAMFTYAYHVNLPAIESKISLGISGMIYQYKLDQSAIVFHNPDVNFEGGVYSEIVPDAAFGSYLYGKNYYVGLSIYQLFESTFREALTFDYGDNIGVRHYFGMAGFTAEINKSLHLEPSILVKTIDAGPIQLDINTRVIFNRKFWTGISLRTDRSVVALMGMNVGNFHLAYGFDYTLASIANHTAGSHEISIGVNIPDPKNRRHVYYWRY